jgi:hypothetical protein
MTPVCTLLLAMIAAPVPGAPHEAMRDDWIGPQVGGRSGPSRDEVKAAMRSGYRPEWDQLFAPAARQPEEDCRTAFDEAGLKAGPWPGAREAGPKGSTTPDGEPSLHFRHVAISADRRLALVARSLYWAPLASEIHFIVLEAGPQGWVAIAHGQYGPVS